MYIPSSLEKVRLRGRRGLFLVVGVDCKQQIAELLPLDDGRARFEEDVPLEAVEPFLDASLETDS